MFKPLNTLLAGHKLFASATIAVLLAAIPIVNSSPIRVTASPVQQVPARFLSPPYYGTTAVNSVYDHEYPTYNDWPETIGNNWVRHYDNTTTGGGARQSYDGHNGIDYDLNYELVRAAAPGDVQHAGWRDPANHQDGEGLYVRIRHDNDHYTIYGHMSVLRVQSGDPILETDEFQRILGISGNTGHSSGPHLHFELEPPSGQYSINPYGWIGGAGNDPWENWSGLASHDVWLRYPSITNDDVYPSGAALHALPIAEDAPDSFTIDDGSPTYYETPGCWTVDNTAGWAGDHRYRNVPGGNCTAIWNFSSSQSAGRYDVFVYIPNVNATTDAARYTIRHTESSSQPWSKQSAWAIVNQWVYPNTYHPSSWVYIGTYYFSNEYSADYVRLEAQPLNLVDPASIAADAVRFVPTRYRIYLPLVMKHPPAETTFYSVADAMVRSGHPNIHYGSSRYMRVGYTDGSQVMQSLVQFDLSEIPSGTPIGQARLWLYVYSSYDPPSASRTIATYRVTSSWTEGSVTWNTRPGFGGMYGFTSIPHDVDGWYSVDVTNLVREWVNGQYSNYGIWIFGNESPSDPNYRGFYTRDSSTGLKPYLEITYGEGAGASGGRTGGEILPVSPLATPEPPAMPGTFRSPLPTPVP